MFIDTILNRLLAPFRELYAKWMNIQAIKGGIQGDTRRVMQLGTQARNYSDQAVRVANEAPGQFRQGVGQVQQGVGAVQEKVAVAKPQGKKMSWFPWSKKTCIGCQKKLHRSWDQCPYCGISQSGGAPQPGMMPQPGAAPGMMPQPGMAPMPAMGGAQRTIAMDVGAINAPLLSAGDRSENVAWLVPLEGAQTGELLQLRGRAKIGTAPGCDFVMVDASISGQHAEISLDAQNRFRVTDLGSTNGTWVNDKRVASSELVDGDNIRLGRTTFRFKTKS